MVIRTTMSLLFGMVFVTLPACGDDAKDQTEKLQGSWQMTKGVRGGQPVPVEKVEKIKVEITNDKIIIRDDSGERLATFKIDSTKKPAQFDITLANQEVPSLGIYKLVGDILTICSANSGESRPTEFESKEGSKTALLVLERQKKK